MNILMMTNTYLPHVGGVATSVDRFACAYRERGHNVLVVAPMYEGAPEREPHVVRIPSLYHFSSGDFSVVLSIPTMLKAEVDRFDPHIIHSHHPFLLGDTALRIGAARRVPVVFTHHTMYEYYTHYVSTDSESLQRFVVALGTGYANLCDHVIAPSNSVRNILMQRGVQTRISVVPSGVELHRFRLGDGQAFRQEHGIPEEAFVIGYSGRLAPEKSLEVLSSGLCEVLRDHANAHFLVVGQGPCGEHIRNAFEGAGISDRLHMTGALRGQSLVDGYHAMDVFGFTSRSETQALVLAEAMAAGVPVVALDAPGARDIIVDGRNGFIVADKGASSLAPALRRMIQLTFERRVDLREQARNTSEAFSVARCAESALRIYGGLVCQKRQEDYLGDNREPSILRSLQEGWRLWGIRLAAIAEAAHGASGDASTS